MDLLYQYIKILTFLYVSNKKGPEAVELERKVQVEDTYQCIVESVLYKESEKGGGEKNRTTWDVGRREVVKVGCG